MLVFGTLGVSTTVLLEAALSFLGVGVQPPTPSWGGIINESQSYFLNAPWLVAFPDVAILLTSLSFNLFEASRDAISAMIEHLGREYGLAPELAYCLCSVDVDLKISEIVDQPNWVVSAYLPKGVFR